jgi:hypothetical protein
MTKIIFYLTAFIMLFACNMQAQDTKQQGEIGQKTFESQVKSIATKIEKITKEEKSALKLEIEAVDAKLENGVITREESDKEKQSLAEKRAKNIEVQVAVEQEKLNNLVQQKVEGKIKVIDSTQTSFTFYFPAMKCNNDKKVKTEKRTTSQFVLAFGVNNLVTNEAVTNSDFDFWESRFFEWGFTNNARIFKNDNLLHLKYGFSVMYNNLRPTDNRYFVPDGNDQTNLEVFPYDLEDSRFKNVYLVAPLHLEFDFTKNKSTNGSSNFRTHRGMRFGIGGYGGFRIKSKQKLFYDEDDDKVRIKTKGDFNANDFIYGVSTYLGYKETSLYLKYDLNPLFKNNTIDQNNISLGIRFDFN